MSKYLTKPEKIFEHFGDLPDWVKFGDMVAIDTEAMGLHVNRDRLCMVQLSFDGKECHLVKFDAKQGYNAPNLVNLLQNENIVKIFHYARFDVALLYYTFGVLVGNIYCTKIASKLARTYTERHGLKTLCNELLGVEISKKEQSSDWGRGNISDDQKMYAAIDVLYLHIIKDKLDEMLEREFKMEIAHECFKCIGCVAKLDCLGWIPESIFAPL